METILTVIHVIGALVLVTIILLQSGKGQGVAAGLGGASGAAKKMFGGGNTQTALGKATVAIGALFMATSITLAYMSSQPDSVMNTQDGERNFGAQQRGQIIEEGGGNESADQPGTTDGESSGAEGTSGAGSSAPDSSDNNSGADN